MPACITLVRLRSNPAFLLGLSVWVAALAVLVFRPGWQVSQSWPIPFSSAPVHHHRPTGPGKLFWGGFTWAVVHWVLCLPMPRLRVLRSATLAMAAVANVAFLNANEQLAASRRIADELAFGTLYERQWDNYCRLRLVEHLPIDGLCSSRKNLFDRNPRSLDDVHRFVMERYREQTPPFRSRLKCRNEELGKAVFIMNFVSSLWAFGNCHAVDALGATLANEESGWVWRTPTLQAYLDSPIACCTDYANVAKALLDREGIDNRLTSIPGHIFNEVCVGGEWYVLDATTNLIVESSWKNLYDQRALTTVTVHLFPHAGALDENSEQYRSRAGQFRLMMLARIANRPPLFRNVEHPAPSPLFVESARLSP